MVNGDGSVFSAQRTKSLTKTNECDRILIFNFKYSAEEQVLWRKDKMGGCTSKLTLIAAVNIECAHLPASEFGQIIA